MKRQMIPCLLLALSLTGCSAAAPSGDRAEFDSYLQTLDEKRDELLSWSEAEKALFPAYAPDFAVQSGAFSKDELNDLIEPKEASDVTGKEAAADVETFFRLLQTTYGGYPYFGGDEVFLPVRDELMTSLSEREKITAEELKNILSEALSGKITDGHLMIGDYYFTMDSEKFMYYVPDLYFDDLTALNPDLVKPTIGPDGQLTCCLAALSHDGSDLPDEAMAGGQKKRLKWKKAESYTAAEDEKMSGYRKMSVSDIPVLESRILYAKEGQTDIQEQLISLAESGGEYRGLPVLIVDLRGNGGGDSFYEKSWIEGFTGRQPQSKVAWFEKCSDPFLKTLAANPAYAMVASDWKSNYYRNAGQWMWGSQDGSLLENQTVVFLLADKETGSSGEDFVRDLSTVAHVIRVGTNTAGVLQFGNVCEFFLPNSGLFVRMGSKMAFYDSLDLSEGTGVLPDLWVNGPDALDAVTRLCKYYGLNQEQSES